MITALNSGADQSSRRFTELERADGVDNLAWLGEAIGRLDDGVAILLVGGYSTVHFTLRVAQRTLRHDRSPSNWSHVALFRRSVADLRSSNHLGRQRIHEIALDPGDKGFGFAPETNGVQRSIVSRYADPDAFPNVAVFTLPGVDASEAARARDTFEHQRGAVDGSALLLRWLGYAWGVGTNPLVEGHGIPSAAMIEEVAMLLDFDLTPGLESRASCPEALWQAAKWWHEYYEETHTGSLQGHYWTPHWMLLPEKGHGA